MMGQNSVPQLSIALRALQLLKSVGRTTGLPVPAHLVWRRVSAQDPLKRVMVCG